jgi:hypothetical protein
VEKVGGRRDVGDDDGDALRMEDLFKSSLDVWRLAKTLRKELW